MEFEWDPDKAVSNVRKHRIDFETGVKVFEDVFRLEYDQPDNVDVMRYAVTGLVEGRLLVVTYTVRGEVYRIISARLADRHERRDYHEI